MKPGYLIAMMLLAPALAQADIYKAVDANGHVTYSSSPIKGGKKLDLAPLSTMSPPKMTSPADFPKVGGETQKGRDDMRRRILQDELAAEENSLAEARKNLSEASPEVFKRADGKTYRNVAKYDEKMKQMAEEVELHEKNISALKTELSKIK